MGETYAALKFQQKEKGNKSLSKVPEKVAGDEIQSSGREIVVFL